MYKYFFLLRPGYPPPNAVTNPFAGLKTPRRVEQLAQKFKAYVQVLDGRGNTNMQNKAYLHSCMPNTAYTFLQISPFFYNTQISPLSFY